MYINTAGVFQQNVYVFEKQRHTHTSKTAQLGLKVRVNAK